MKRQTYNHLKAWKQKEMLFIRFSKFNEKIKHELHNLKCILAYDCDLRRCSVRDGHKAIKMMIVRLLAVVYGH